MDAHNNNQFKKSSAQVRYLNKPFNELFPASKIDTEL